MTLIEYIEFEKNCIKTDLDTDLWDYFMDKHKGSIYAPLSAYWRNESEFLKHCVSMIDDPCEDYEETDYELAHYNEIMERFKKDMLTFYQQKCVECGYDSTSEYFTELYAKELKKAEEDSDYVIAGQRY